MPTSNEVGTKMAQIDITKPKRRTYSKELKAYLVEQALTGERSIARLAQGHCINPNLLQKWIRAARNNKISTTISQPLKSLTSNINHTLIEHEPAFLPVTLQHKAKHEPTPQATALAQTITGVELQIPKHNVGIRPYPIAEVAKHEVATHQAAYWNGWADV